MRDTEQIIDNVNIDTVLYAGYDVSQEETASRVIETFREFIQENRDEITALRIICDLLKLLPLRGCHLGIQADDAAGQGGEGVLILRPQRHQD